ncbi:MAG: hypothetical protein GX267_03670 [Fibrobacter sp.]|jgi:tetratricopeptide (TPR) repeat protein|nr:hypothetical protein [Fibrobacter sp.]
MKKIHLFFCVFLSILKLTSAQAYQWDQAVYSILDLVMKQEYDSAYKICNLRITADSMDIDSRYLKLVTLQSQLADYESYSLDGLRCIAMAESLITFLDNAMSIRSSPEEKEKADFLKGNIYGVLGIVKAKRGSILSSIRDARLSYEHFKRLKQSPSFLPDVLYGLGLFDYYIGDNLKWIPGVGKRARSGLEMLYTASKSDSPFRYGAKNSLVWVLMERGEFREADSIASEVLEKYPGSTLFLQVKSRAAFGNRQYQHAIELAEQLISLSLKRKVINWCDVLSGYQLIASCHIKLGNKKKAQEIASEGLAYELSDDTLRIEWVQKHRNSLMSIK